MVHQFPGCHISDCRWGTECFKSSLFCFILFLIPHNKSCCSSKEVGENALPDTLVLYVWRVVLCFFNVWERSNSQPLTCNLKYSQQQRICHVKLQIAWLGSIQKRFIGDRLAKNTCIWATCTIMRAIPQRLVSGDPSQLPLYREEHEIPKHECSLWLTQLQLQLTLLALHVRAVITSFCLIHLTHLFTLESNKSNWSVGATKSFWQALDTSLGICLQKEQAD